MPDSLLPDGGGGWLAMIITGLGVGGTAVYKAWRTFKDDRTADRGAEKAQSALDKVLERMEIEIARQNKVILDLTAKVDKLTDEKDELTAKLATALANEIVLKAKAEELTKDVAEIRAKLTVAEQMLTAKDTGDRRRISDFHSKTIDDRDVKDLP
jgi:chromosome segregation ATPase